MKVVWWPYFSREKEEVSALENPRVPEVPK